MCIVKILWFNCACTSNAILALLDSWSRCGWNYTSRQWNQCIAAGHFNHTMLQGIYAMGNDKDAEKSFYMVQRLGEILCSWPNNLMVTLVHYRLNIFEIVSRSQNHTLGLEKELFLNFCLSHFKWSQMIATILVFYRKSNCRPWGLNLRMK